MYGITISKTVTYVIALERQELLDTMLDATGVPVALDSEADEADQLYDMINGSSEIMERLIKHPDVTVDNEDTVLDELDSDA